MTIRKQIKGIKLYENGVYLVNGRCKAQIYQGSQLRDLYNFASPTGSWQTFTGTYTPIDANMIIRFYGYDSAGSSEFYVDDVSFKPN